MEEEKTFSPDNQGRGTADEAQAPGLKEKLAQEAAEIGKQLNNIAQAIAAADLEIDLRAELTAKIDSHLEKIIEHSQSNAVTLKLEQAAGRARKNKSAADLDVDIETDLQIAAVFINQELDKILHDVAKTPFKSDEARLKLLGELDNYADRIRDLTLHRIPEVIS